MYSVAQSSTFLLTFDATNAPDNLIGTYTVSIDVTNAEMNTVTLTHSLLIVAEILPSFISPIPLLDFTDGTPSVITMPAADGGSFDLVDADVDFEPCCLSDYFSLH